MKIIYTLLLILLFAKNAFAKLVATTYNSQNLNDVNYIYQDRNNNIEIYNPKNLSTTYINNE